MKRILIFLFLLAFALPAWAATGSATWDGSTDQDWNVDTNWTPEQHPADGDTATFDGGEGANNLPTSNQPADPGHAINFVITSPYANKYIDADFLGGAGAGIGTISISNLVGIDANFTTATVNANGYLVVKGSTTVQGNVVLAGGALVAVEALAVLDGNVTATDTSTVDWSSGNLDITGGFDASTQTVTHSNTTGSTLTCDQAGDLELGGDATGLEVSTTAAVDLDDDLNIYAFTMGANITCASAREVTIRAGGFTYSAGTLTGDLDITVGTVTTTAVWDTTTNQFRTLTVNASITPSGYIRCKALAGSGAIVTASGKNPILYPAASNFWTYAGALSGAGGANIYLTASQSNAAAIEIDTSSPVSIRSDDFTLTASGGVTGGALEIRSTSANKTSTVSCTGSLSCTSVTLGAVTTNYGALELGSGAVHTVSGAIVKGSTGTANALNPQGRVILGGTFTGTGIVVTPTYEGEIDCQGAGRVTAVTSTGRRLVVRRAVDASGNPVRSWNGDSCTNVRFLGRKIIGALDGVN